MIPVLQKLSGLYVWYVLVILTLGYLTAELGHFLIGVTSKATASDIHYGDVACQWIQTDGNEFNTTLFESCTKATDEISCGNLTMGNGEQFCEWNYNGLGYDYQVLAGPSFIGVYTVVGVLFGIAADKYKRVPMVASCVLICGASVILMGACNKFWQLLVLRMIFAAGEAGLNPMSTGILSDLFPEDLRGLVMSIFNWGIYGGIGLSFPVGRYVTEINAWDLGWRVAYYSSGIVALIIGGLITTSLKEPARTVIGEETEEAADAAAGPGHQSEQKKEKAWKVMLQPRFIMLCIAASIRHTGGLCFAYNCDLFYRFMFPHIDLGGWLFFVTFVIGGVGVIVGGIVSDKVVASMGIKSRAAVLAISQLIATPFAFGSIYMGPVGAMITLAISYLFAEMWFGILFAILVEIVPLSVRSTTVGVFLFVMNNIGGNLPILVEPVRKATSYQFSLAIFYAGAYLISSVLFAITTLLMGKTKKEKQKAVNSSQQPMQGIDNSAFTSIEQVTTNRPAVVNSRTIESHRL